LARDAIWQALKEKGVSPKIISIIKAIYEQSTCNVVQEIDIGTDTSVEWSKTGMHSFTPVVQCHSRLCDVQSK